VRLHAHSSGAQKFADRRSLFNYLEDVQEARTEVSGGRRANGAPARMPGALGER
jgi:hypothetical protein